MAKAVADAKPDIMAYLQAQPPVARRALKEVRALVRAAAPDAVEAFSYRIPGFRLDGRVFIWYAGFTNHFSLFPIGPRLVRSLGKAAARYETSKGTIRFPLDEPVPVSLIKRIVKARVAEVRDRG